MSPGKGASSEAPDYREPESYLDATDETGHRTRGTTPGPFVVRFGLGGEVRSDSGQVRIHDGASYVSISNDSIPGLIRALSEVRKQR